MQMLKDKLKPCPFCGSMKVTFKNVLTDGMPLVCIKCICGGGVYAPTAHEAVERWNERSDANDEQRKADTNQHLRPAVQDIKSQI